LLLLLSLSLLSLLVARKGRQPPEGFHPPKPARPPSPSPPSLLPR
jgi:hypothetical protein